MKKKINTHTQLNIKKYFYFQVVINMAKNNLLITFYGIDNRWCLESIC